METQEHGKFYNVSSKVASVALVCFAAVGMNTVFHTVKRKLNK